MKAALYARVSSEEQAEGCSIDAQLRACRDYAKDAGWTVVAEYVDEGKSASAEDISKRPNFKAMLEAARDGDVVAVKPQPDFEPLFKMKWEECPKIVQWRPRGDSNP